MSTLFDCLSRDVTRTLFSVGLKLAAFCEKRSALSSEITLPLLSDGLKLATFCDIRCTGGKLMLCLVLCEESSTPLADRFELKLAGDLLLLNSCLFKESLSASKL